MKKTIDSNVVAAAFDSVFEFNDISKQFDKDPVAAVDLQIDLIFEELTETISAMDAGLSELRNKNLKECEVELLDGAVDVFVVVSGLLQKLQYFGFDVEKALLRVPENNMSKFPVAISPQDTNWYASQGWETEYNHKYNRFVIRDINGKTRKSVDFVPVVLDDLVPGNFFKGLSNV